MQDRAFPALRELLVSIAHAEAPDFLGHIDPSFLDAVTVYWEYLFCDASSSGNVLESILMKLGELRQQPRHVRVVLDETMERMLHRPSPSHALKPLPGSAESLEPILSFTCLCTLKIGIDVVFQLDNDFISEISQHLPNLESLALVPLLKTDFSLVRFQQEEQETGQEDPGMDTRDTDGGVRRMLPTFDGLVSLVQGCPRLSTLKVAVESTIVASDAISCASRDGSRVRHMELWATGLDPRLPDAAFHKFFTAYFPLLDYLHVVLPIEPHSQSELDPAVRDDLISVPISRDQARARWDAILREMPLRTSV
ncbi:hypothetical protein BN946_scf184996.g17 [Trametes cinnabarina]|uniref:Uncharacterized protein n=1 Tax=Pycnoporus cinnabarinus TaxID=5643 RepID=A0A060S317_PYCCI|nr:hypothetical protein BN946_scf184996.g17 [Trametes cinnabarina]